MFCCCVLLIVEMIKKIGQNDLHFLFGHFTVLGKMKQTIEEENVRERKKRQKCLESQKMLGKGKISK